MCSRAARTPPGAGVGWMREGSPEATWVPDFSRPRSTPTRRSQRCGHCGRCRPTRRARASRGASFHGEFFDFDDVWSELLLCAPRGCRSTSGDSSQAAARRCGRLGDGFHPLGLDDDLLVERWQLASCASPRSTAVTPTHSSCRSPSAWDHSTPPPRQPALRRAGVHRMVAAPTAVAELGRLRDDMSAAAAAVGPTPA